VIATWLLSFGLFGLTLMGKVKGRQVVNVLGVCILAAMIVGATSCGGGSTASSTAFKPGNASSYTVTINGTASSVQLATTVTVTVK